MYDIQIEFQTYLITCMNRALITPCFTQYDIVKKKFLVKFKQPS